MLFVKFFMQVAKIIIYKFYPIRNMNNALLDKFRNICLKLGKNNKPTYVVMAIAAVKGICRPTFTMMDKKEEPKTKKYTAIREGLTEIIAIPVYWGLGEGSAKLANKFLPDELKAKGAKNCMLIGVCTAALFVIPGLCSLAIKPLMEKFYHNDKGALAKKFDEISTTPPDKKTLNSQMYSPVKRPSLQTFVNSNQYGMKVGGV